MNKNIRSIVVSGKRWWDGYNTYHSCHVWVDGDHVGGVNYQYGYDDAYMQTAQKIIVDAGILKPEYDNQSLWQMCNNANIKLVRIATDVQRKKHL